MGGTGQTAAVGGSGKMTVNFLRRVRTTAQGSVGGLIFPSTLTQASLIGQPGVLTLGTGTFKQTYFFSLDKRGRGKATALPKVQLDIAKKRFLFKVNNRTGLTDLAESIGATFVRNTKTGPVFVILLPATLQIDSSVYLAMTFVLNYHQIGTSGKATLK